MPYSVVSQNGDAYEGVSISDRKQGTTTIISCFIYISLNIRSRMFTDKIPTVMSCSTCSIASSFTPCFSGVRVSYSLVFFVMFCRSLFDLFLLASVLSVLLCNVLYIIVFPQTLAIILSILRFTASDYHFSIFKLFSISPRHR